VVPTGSMPSPIVVPRTVTLVPPLNVLPISHSVSTPISETGDSPPPIPVPKNNESPAKQLSTEPTKSNESPSKQNLPAGSPVEKANDKKTPKVTAGLPPRSNATNWRSPNLVAREIPQQQIAATGNQSPSPIVRAMPNPNPNPRASPPGPRGINPSPTLKAAESPRLAADSKKAPPGLAPKQPSAGRGRPREGSFEFTLAGSQASPTFSPENPNVTVHLPASPSLSAMALMKSITPGPVAVSAEPVKQKTPVLRPRKGSQVDVPGPVDPSVADRRGESPLESGLRRLSLQKKGQYRACSYRKPLCRRPHGR